MSNLTNPVFNRMGETNGKGNNGNGKSNDKNKYEFHLAEYEEFPSIADTAAIVTKTLGAKISEFIGLAYKDFHGCTVQVAPNGAFLDVKLYFSKTASRGDDLPNGFTDYNKVNSSGSGLIDKINNIGGRNSQKMYYRTKELEDGLGRFLFGAERGDSFRPNWDQLIYEQSEQSPMGVTTYAVVTGIDINKLLPELYGAKDSSGEYFYYNIDIRRPTSFVGANGMMLPMGSINYLLTITRFNSSKLKSIACELGVIQNGNSLGIITPN